MKAFLLLNGECPVQFPDMEKYDMICATDGAYKHLLDRNIEPHWISGDFDSLQNIPKEIKAIHTPNQDDTDFEKALKILFENDCYDVDVYGASGKEQDHFLGNISTALAWKGEINITFYDDYGFYFIADKNMVLSDVLGKTISLLPLPVAKGITAKGLQYRLTDGELHFGKRIGTRNKAIANQVKITYTYGVLLVFVNESI